jgi:CHAT domain-containing protein
MVTPTKLDNNEEGPPQFYVLRNAYWREVPVAGGAIGRPSEIRKSMDERLTTIMNNPIGARPALVVQFRDFWSKWVPESVQREVAELPRTDDDPPCLMLYVHQTLEWIPWELMHDGTDFLGLRYVIARLPIVRRGPSSTVEKRVVQRVSTFLGEHVMDDVQLAEWETTFDGLPNGVAVDRFPTNDVWPTADNVTQQAAQSDILHITCHGGIKDETFNTVWTLNAQGPPHVYGLGTPGVEQMTFGDTGGPLVFGNACQGAAGVATATGLVPGLAYSFFDNGATAFVGAFAPLDKTMALRFSTAFYGHLLTDGLGIGRALWQTKSDFKAADEPNPSWLFYCLYGAPDTQFAVA